MSDKQVERAVLVSYGVFAFCLLMGALPPPPGLEWVPLVLMGMMIPAALVCAGGAFLMARRLGRNDG